MALLPIIYLSLLITTALILIVITASYIASKMRNRGNEDRILALASNSTNYPDQINPEPKKVVVQTKTHRTHKKHSRDNMHIEKERYAESYPRITRVSMENENRRTGNSTGYETRTYYSENRYSNQRQNERLTVVNMSAKSSSQSGGELSKDKLNKVDPLYFYSVDNEQKYYTINAY